MRRLVAFCLLSATKRQTWIANTFHTLADRSVTKLSTRKFGGTSTIYPRSFARFARMTNFQQELITIPAEENHSATVLFLHGLGDQGSAYLTRFQSIRIPYIKYLLPTAPIIAVDWQQGEKMPLGSM